MLRETAAYISYPNKTVIEDIIMRDGPADADSFSPFEGKKSILESQFSGSQRAKFKIADFLKYTGNRDLNPAAVKASAKYGMLEEGTRTVAGFRTLDDMIVNGQESKEVENYLVMMCVGFKKDKESPYRVGQHEYTRTLRNSGDDDGETEEKYLIERDDENISNEDYESTLLELPYLIKSIWSYSKQMQGNLFSFAFAYADIVERKHGRTDVNIQDFRNYTTYCINKDGSFKKVFSHADDNKYVIYPALTKVFIAPGSHRAEYNLCMKFLNSLKVLGIDYHDENPLQFDNEFMKKLVCTYLPGNEQYIQEYKGVDPEIIVALAPENVFATAKASLYVPVDTVDDSYDYTQGMYFIGESLDLAYKINKANKDVSLFMDDQQTALKILQKYLAIVSGNPDIQLPMSKLFFHPTTGILYMKDADTRRRNRVQDCLVLDGKYFGTFKASSEYKVLLTKYGFIVAIEEDYDSIYYLSAEHCLESLEVYDDKYAKREEHWKRLGVYSE